MTKPMTKVEQVAEALLNIHRKRNGWLPASLGELLPEHRAEWLEEARAAIEAMRVPTLAMRKVCRFEVAEVDYPAMIDAALSEEGE